MSWSTAKKKCFLKAAFQDRKLKYFAEDQQKC